MEKKDSSELNLPLFGFADPNATGKNVAVYILDAPYTPSKETYKRVMEIDGKPVVLPDPDPISNNEKRPKECPWLHQSHGSAVATVACGNGSGIAKESSIYMYSSYPEEGTEAELATILKKVLAIREHFQTLRRKGTQAVLNCSFQLSVNGYFQDKSLGIDQAIPVLQSFRALGEVLNNLIEEGMIVVAAAGNSNRTYGSGDKTHSFEGWIKQMKDLEDDKIINHESPEYGSKMGREFVNQWGTDILMPGCLEKVITVGATDESGEKAKISSYGDLVNFYAPGLSLRPSVPLLADGKETLTGTSFAAPQVTGMIASILSRQKMTNDQVLQYLTQNSATKDENVYPGYGRNGFKILALTPSMSLDCNMEKSKVKGFFNSKRADQK